MMSRQLHQRAGTFALPLNEPSQHPLEVGQHEGESLGPVSQVREAEADADVSDVLSINRVREVLDGVALC